MPEGFQLSLQQLSRQLFVHFELMEVQAVEIDGTLIRASSRSPCRYARRAACASRLAANLALA
jgi:hypothetical protein